MGDDSGYETGNSLPFKLEKFLHTYLSQYRRRSVIQPSWVQNGLYRRLHFRSRDIGPFPFD